MSDKVCKMPTYETSIDGKPRKVELAEKGKDTFIAKVDDKSHTVEFQASRIGAEHAFTMRIDEKTYEIELPKVEQGKIVSVRVEGALFNVEIRASGKRQATTSLESAPAPPLAWKSSRYKQSATEGAITAPMTGKIVKVKVQKGDEVKANQVLCIIEAMKMENEITAPKSGVVQEVIIAEGSPVNEGDVLVVVS